MVVLHVCAFAAPNAGNFIATLTQLEQTLGARGIQTIYAFSDGARDKSWCREIQKRTKVYFLPTANARILPETYRIFSAIHKENRVDIIHSHFELYDVPATVTAPKGARIFWHLHDALKENYMKAGTTRKLLTRLQYGIFSSRAVLLSVSEEHAAFAKDLGFPAEKIQYFPNGINTDRIKPVSFAQSEGFFLQFGWEVIRKGVDLVVQAARLVRSADVRIVIVGQEKCREYLEENCPSDMIQYRTPVNDINALYCNAKAFLHVSRAEGLSYALLEAIYAGLPVICSDIPENQFARAFRNVFFVENENTEEIARTIDCVNSQASGVQQADVDFNRALIRQQYSLDAWVDRLVRLYLE